MSQSATSNTVTEPSVVARGPSPAAAAVTTIVPARRRVRVSDLPGTLPISWVLTVRDFKVRYKQSLLGPLWLVLQPLGVLAAFAVVFDAVADVDTGGVPYGLFALVGVTVWTFANQCLALGTRCHLANKQIIRYVACPRVAFVTASTAASFPSLAVPLLLTFAAMALAAHEPGIGIVLLPLAIAWTFLLLWSLTLALSAANVRFRDVGNLVPLVLQGGIFLTPVGYPLSAVSGVLHTLLAMNPFSGLLEFWRWSMLDASVDWAIVGIAGAETALIAVLGWQLFARLEVAFADVI